MVHEVIDASGHTRSGLPVGACANLEEMSRLIYRVVVALGGMIESFAEQFYVNAAIAIT
jgi:hypothetical protein